MLYRSLIVIGLISVAAAVTTGVVIAPEDDPDFPAFQAWLTKHSRFYATASEMRGRFSIFKENLARARQLTAKSKKKATFGMNKFADIHIDEFARMFKGYRPSHKTSTVEKNLTVGVLSETSGAAAKTIDWYSKGACTPVKNQGQCGSCWAFSATEQIESDYFLATGSLPVLSPQQVVSCDTVDLGCNGGNTENAYAYVYQAGGIEPSADYPYTSGTTQADGTCRFDAKDVAVKIRGYYSVTNEDAMLGRIASGPMSVCVDATIWQTYQSGIIQAGTCGTALDHCVQVTGYNAEGNYWVVRNSWGTDWGENGFIYVAAGHDTCGIADDTTTVAIA